MAHLKMEKSQRTGRQKTSRENRDYSYYLPAEN